MGRGCVVVCGWLWGCARGAGVGCFEEAFVGRRVASGGVRGRLVEKISDPGYVRFGVGRIAGVI